MEVNGQLYAPATLPQGKSPWYLLDRWLTGPQSRSGRGGKEKNSQPSTGNRTLEPWSSEYQKCFILFNLLPTFTPNFNVDSNFREDICVENISPTEDCRLVVLAAHRCVGKSRTCYNVTLSLSSGRGKGKVVLVLNQVPRLDDVWAFLTSALDGGQWSASHPGRLTSRERAPGIHRIGGWVGPRPGLDAVAKRNNHIIVPSRNWTRSSSP
jgi:hypothetical protein